ncbi:carbohydrate ABC transporter permease, partial [Streptomyces ipomoeae]
MRRTSSTRRTARGRQARAAWVLAAPFLALFLAFMLLSVVWSTLMSLTDTKSADLRTPLNVSFVGFDNYVRLFQDPQFFTALRNTGVFVLVALPLTLATGLAAAVALDRGIRRFRTVFRVGFYLPVITSIVANPDGSTALVTYNSGSGDRTFTVRWGKRHFSYRDLFAVLR